MKFLGDLIGAVGGLIGASMESDAAEQANALQYQMFKEGQDFNKEVMQSRHQWEVQDLRQAGLNPLMSVTSPTGTLSSPAAPAAHKANTAASAAALGQMLGGLTVQNKMAEAAQTNADAAKIGAIAQDKKANIEKDKFIWESTDKFKKESELIDAQVNNAFADSKMKASITARNLIENEWLPKIKEAELNEVQQKIAASIAITAAQCAYYEKAGDAALSQAAAAHRLAANAEMLGLHQAELTDADVKKAKAETAKISAEFARTARENRYAEYNESRELYKSTRFIGDVLDNLNPLKGFISVPK